MVKLTIFRATGAWLVVLDNSKPMHPAGCSEEERGRIWQTAAGNWACSGIRLTETPYWWRHATQIRLVRKCGKFAWTSLMHQVSVLMRCLRSFLKRLFAAKQVVATQNVGCFLSLELNQSVYYAGEQGTYWDNTNKELTSFKMEISLVFVVPVHLLFSSMAILYHVNR